MVATLAALLAAALVTCAVLLPQEVVDLLQPISVKFLLSEIGLMLISIAAILAYWSLQVPKTASVALGLLRACLCIATASISTPFSFFGLQSLAVAIGKTATVNVSWDRSSSPAFITGIVALVIAYFALREYRQARLYEYVHGLSSEI
jgi:hypothetical protein